MNAKQFTILHRERARAGSLLRDFGFSKTLRRQWFFLHRNVPPEKLIEMVRAEFRKARMPVREIKENEL